MQKRNPMKPYQLIAIAWSPFVGFIAGYGGWSLWQALAAWIGLYLAVALPIELAGRNRR